MRHIHKQAVGSLKLLRNGEEEERPRRTERDGIVRTYKKDETLGRGRNAWRDGIHAVDDRGLEVDVEDAEHVD